MTNIVKKDIVQGSLAYNSLLTELKRHARAIGGSNTMGGLDTDTETEEIGLEMLLPRYKEILTKMDALRRIDFDKFISFAQALKNQSGQKFVFFIYQREFRPEISPAVIHKLMAALSRRAAYPGRDPGSSSWPIPGTSPRISSHCGKASPILRRNST